MRLHKAGAGQLDDLRFGNLRIKTPLEIGERLHGGDAGLREPACEEAVRAARELVLDEQFQKLEVRERRRFGFCDATGRASTIPDRRRWRNRLVSWGFIVGRPPRCIGSSGEWPDRRSRASAWSCRHPLDELPNGLIPKVLVGMRFRDRR